MKKLLLACAFVFATVLGYAQQVPEKSNAIVLTQSDSIGIRDKVLKLLADKDYTLSSSKTAATLITAPKTLKSGARVYFTFQFKGKDIIIMGKLPVAGQATMSIVYQGKEGTPSMKGWEEMEKIAKALGGALKYETK